MNAFFTSIYVASKNPAIQIGPCDVALVSKINSAGIVGLESEIRSDEIVGLESKQCECPDE